MKYCLDASSLIALEYERYPQKYFPTLYRKFEELPLSSCIFVIKPIFNEIETFETKPERLHEEKPIRYWLENKLNLKITAVDDSVHQRSLYLQNQYKVDSSSKKGASYQDITLIAFALINSLTVVSEEARQPNPPDEHRKWKIPIICEHEDIRCINLLEFIKELDIRA